MTVWSTGSTSVGIVPLGGRVAYVGGGNGSSEAAGLDLDLGLDLGLALIVVLSGFLKMEFRMRMADRVSDR